ncbi:MAG: N-acetylmuramoyl-L-alanine amidase [bacterium]
MRPARLCVLLAALAAVAAAQFPISFAGAELEVNNAAGVDYVRLSGVVAALSGRSWQVGDRFIAVLPGDSARVGSEYVFWADSTIVRQSAAPPDTGRAVAPPGEQDPGRSCREIQLPFRPIRNEDQLWIPVLSLADLFPLELDETPALRLLDVSERGDTLVLCFGGADGGRVSWHGEVRSSLAYRLAFAARCDTQTTAQLALVPILAANGMVQEARVEPAAGAVLQLMFRRPAAVRATEEPEGVVVRVWPRPQRRLQRLVLDPGHGGKDPGAVGRAGTLEKEVVLDMVLRLKTLLEGQGFEVLLTRGRDEYVPLLRRSQFAREQRADLFISVHANASENRNACGFETYFLSEAKTDWERAVAARENAAIELDRNDQQPMGDELELILADLAQNEYLTESSELAAAIQERTVPQARVLDRGVRQANFYVLRQNYMPAVLVEVGFLSNASEEKLLRNSQHREKLADGISQGIVEFVRRYERRLNGS